MTLSPNVFFVTFVPPPLVCAARVSTPGEPRLTIKCASTSQICSLTSQYILITGRDLTRVSCLLVGGTRARRQQQNCFSSTLNASLDGAAWHVVTSCTIICYTSSSTIVMCLGRVVSFMRRLGELLTSAKFLVLLLPAIFLFNEFIIYYLVVSQCQWSGTDHTNVMIIADTHLLGRRHGHWFDKLRRSVTRAALRLLEF